MTIKSAEADVAGLTPARLHTLYEQLHAAYGEQDWWPADTPFEVIVGAILTQNTAWENVEKALDRLKAEKALTPMGLLAVPSEQLAEWIRPSGYYRLKARRLQALVGWVVSRGVEHGRSAATTNELRPDLLAVHGVGPETCDDILLYALDRPVFVIDAYTRRLWSRLGWVGGDEPYEALRAAAESGLPSDVALFKEYHALVVVHAKAHCRSKPFCAGCPLVDECLAVDANS